MMLPSRFRSAPEPLMSPCFWPFNFRYAFSAMVPCLLSVRESAASYHYDRRRDSLESFGCCGSSGLTPPNHEHRMARCKKSLTDCLEAVRCSLFRKELQDVESDAGVDVLLVRRTRLPDSRGR